MANDTQSRAYQLTINNPLDSPHDFSHANIKELLALKFKTFVYAAMADEIGEQGTYHTHVYCCFSSAVRFSTVKKHFPTAHIEAVKGSVQDNIDYLQKTGKWENTAKAETSVDGSFEELGERPANEGKNKLLSDLYHYVVDEGMSNTEIIRLNTDYIPMLDTITRIRTAFLQEKFRNTRRNLEVTYVSGITGAGKSRGILDQYGDENVYRVTDYDHPFDTYNTEDVLVLEEFRSSLKITDVLNYLDIYPIVLPARYAPKIACFTHVYLCSNLPLHNQYEEIQRRNPESWKAFLRRIHKVRIYTEVGKFIDYDSVDEYMRQHWAHLPAKKDDDNPFTKGE